jgi:hypothetical protein
MNFIRKWFDALTGKDLPLPPVHRSGPADDPDHLFPLPTTQPERAAIPVTWLVIVGLVIVGALVNIFLPGGVVVWPFVFAVSLLLIVNSASERHGVGVPPFQAYALCFGVLLVFFVFIALVSRINAWLVVVLTILAGGYLLQDRSVRRHRARVLDVRRAAGLCVRCATPVGRGRDDVCPRCGTPAHPDRVNLFHLGNAIRQNARFTASGARQVLSGTKPSRSDVKANTLLGRRSTAHKRGR